jgi:hypothetical protein
VGDGQLGAVDLVVDVLSALLRDRHGLSRIRTGEQEAPEFVASRLDADLVPGQLAEHGAEFPRWPGSRTGQ